jgi:hypothetical protein
MSKSNENIKRAIESKERFKKEYQPGSSDTGINIEDDEFIEGPSKVETKKSEATNP